MVRIRMVLLLVVFGGMLWLSGPAAGQAPMPAPGAPAGVPVIMEGGCCPAACCPAPCCTPCSTCCDQCVKVQGVKKITKPIYDCKVVEYCTKGISFGYEHGCCKKCGDACCYHHTKKVLMKKFVTEECPTCICEPLSKQAAPAVIGPSRPGIDRPF